jgi:hypothetical protein
MPRWIIRPRKIGTTPRQLAQRLDCSTRQYPSEQNKRKGFSFLRDFLLVYPDPDYLERMDDTDTQTYHQLYRFFSRNKCEQRTLLKSAGLPIPDTTGRRVTAALWGAGHEETTTNSTDESLQNRTTFIVRPLRHHGGIGFRLTQDATDFIEGEEYVQKLFPKTREYRLIYCYGELLSVLRKKAPGTSADQPWNHLSGAHFQTINDIPNCKLSSTDCFDKLKQNHIIKTAHLVAVDVLYAKRKYVICEFNSCPGLTIENNLQKVVQHVQATEIIQR